MIPALQDHFLPNPFAGRHDPEPCEPVERPPLVAVVPAFLYEEAKVMIDSLKAEVAKLTAELRMAHLNAAPKNALQTAMNNGINPLKGPRDRALSSLSHDFPQLLRSCFEEDLYRHEIRLCVQTTDGRCHYTIVDRGSTVMYEAAADEMSGFLQSQGYVSKRAQQKLAIFNLSPSMPPTAPAAPHFSNKTDVCQEALGQKQTWPPQPVIVKWPF